MFGAPEFSAEVDGGIITDIQVIRGAPCGATWDAAGEVIGLGVDDALVKIGLKTQFFCSANPAGWDPMYGKSPVHFAGEIHKKALQKAIKKSISRLT